MHTILEKLHFFCDTVIIKKKGLGQAYMHSVRFLTLIAAISMPVMLHAGDPPPFPDFTFKMGKPPKAGAGKRITIQIEPEATQPDVSADKPKQGGPTSAAYAWFWQSVSPQIGENPAGRLDTAFEHLAKGPGNSRVKEPRFQTLQTIAAAEGQRILGATIGTQVSPALVLAVIAVESGGRPTAVSPKGAQGLMQLMPDTASRFGVTDSLSPEQNIKAGVAYLDWLLSEFGGDAVLALAGYNAGENAVKKHKGVPPFAETRDYVPKVLAAYKVAIGLCKTKPAFITDACALNIAMR